MSDSNKKIYAIAKESNYKAMTTQKTFEGKIVDIATTKYRTDFQSVGSGSSVIAVVDKFNDSTQFSLMPISLSTIFIECSPLTSLLCFWVSEEMRKMEFLITGVNDEFAHVPEIRYTFNVFHVYNYGKTGTLFWLLIAIYAFTILIIFTYRLIRLAIKRFSQLRKIEGVKKIISKEYRYSPGLEDYKEGLDQQTPGDTPKKDEAGRNTLELAESQYID